MHARTHTQVSTVRDFLAAHGVAGCTSSANSDFIHCDVTVAKAEEMLSTTYFVYTHSRDASLTVMRASTHYTVPRAVACCLDLVSPTNRFPAVRAKRTTPSITASAPLRENTPKSLRELYSVGDVEGTAAANKMACTAFLGQHYKDTDLAKFWKTCVACSPNHFITPPRTHVQTEA